MYTVVWFGIFLTTHIPFSLQITAHMKVNSELVYDFHLVCFIRLKILPLHWFTLHLALKKSRCLITYPIFYKSFNQSSNSDFRSGENLTSRLMSTISLWLKILIRDWEIANFRYWLQVSCLVWHSFSYDRLPLIRHSMFWKTRWYMAQNAIENKRLCFYECKRLCA